jgi:hypothetical protein
MVGELVGLLLVTGHENEGKSNASKGHIYWQAE